MNYRFDCKDFNGYKPCRPGWLCKTCEHYRPQGVRVLIINLDALGDVLMTTALLPAIKEKYPVSTVLWLTAESAVPILLHNPLIDEIIPYNLDTVSYLQHLEFDLVISCDRDRKSTALAMSVKSADKRGFGLGSYGQIIYLNPEFDYAYRLGLDDDLKFKKNRQTGQQILAEGIGLTYRRHEYILEFTPDEQKFISDFRADAGLTDDLSVLGVNTGCSDKFPYKRLKQDHLISVLQTILAYQGSDRVRLLLLGGRDETEYNREIHRMLNDPRVIETPCTEGIRKGLLYIAASDVCLTGDTFGLHAAIALKKPVATFFTISCDAEIDLYDRGILLCADVPCRPCWKSHCPDPVCLDRIDLNALAEAAWQLLNSYGNTSR